MTTEINRNNSETSLSAPPSYTNAVYKLEENDFDHLPPPSYSDVSNQRIVYLNNYPGPPSTDGVVQIDPSSASSTHRTLSKPICIYLILLGVVTILCGFAAIGIQIGMIIGKSIQYYYGFWSGAILISIGWSVLFFYRHRSTITPVKLFHSFISHMILILILFIIGLILLITNKCDDAQPCRVADQIFNGVLLGIFAFQFIFSVVNLFVFRYLKREQI